MEKEVNSRPWWSCPCGSSGGPMYSISYTLPHSGQRSRGRSRDICAVILVTIGGVYDREGDPMFPAVR